MSRRAWLAAVVAWAACDAAECDRTSREASREPEHEPASSRAELPANLPSEPDVPVLDDVSPAVGSDAVPERGCAETSMRTVVWPHGGPAALAPYGDGFLLAGYAPIEGEGEEIFLATAAAGRPASPIARAPIEVPARVVRTAPPAILVLGSRGFVAMVDGRGVLSAAVVSPIQPGAALRFQQVAPRADLRFAPVLTRAGDSVLVAYVDGRGTPMRVHVARIDLGGKVQSTHDATLEAMGGTSPAFVAGATPPELVYVDARAGISPLVRVTIAPDGTPRTGRVALSVGQVSEPPDLAAARTPAGVVVGYTAVGSGATTAVGYVRLDAPEQPPVPLVRGTGYGPLGVAATALPNAALFVSEAPTAPAPDAPRELHLRVVDAEGAGPPYVLRASRTTAKHPEVARRDDGTIGVAYAAGAVRLAFLRCDESDD